MRPGASFERVYREHVGFVWSAARAFGVRSAAVEDAVQDVFVVVHRKLEALADGVSPRPWLYAVTRRVAFRYRRTAARTARRHREVAHASTSPPLPDNDAARWLRRFLGTLDAEQRQTFVMAELLGMSGPEIAEAQRVPLNTAYSRLRLARQRLTALARSPDHAREVLREAKDEPISDAKVQRMWAALVPALPGTVAASVGTTGWFAGWSTAWGVGAGGLAAAAVVASVVAWSVPHVDVSPADVVVVAPEPRNNMPPPDPATEPKQARGDQRLGKPTSPPPTAPALASAASSSTAAAKPKADRRGSVADPSRLPSPPVGAALAPSAGAELAEEVRMLDAAKDALARGEARVAIKGLDDHARRFSKSRLADVREATRVRALRALGKAAQAKRATASLRCTYPESNVVRALPGSKVKCP